MKVKCISEDDTSFTLGQIYDVLHVDGEGDIWVHDDSGCEYFFYPEECEVIDESN